MTFSVRLTSTLKINDMLKATVKLYPTAIYVAITTEFFSIQNNVAMNCD